MNSAAQVHLLRGRPVQGCPMVKVGTRQFSVLLLLFGTGPEIELLTQLAKHLGRLVQCFDHPSELAQDNSLLCFYYQFWRCKSKFFVFGVGRTESMDVRKLRQYLSGAPAIAINASWLNINPTSQGNAFCMKP